MSEPEVPLAKGFEKFSPVPYDDGYGFFTILWGHKILPGEKFPNPASEELGDQVFYTDMGKARAAVSKFAPVPLNDNQRGALRDFCFNAGGGTFQRSTFRQALLRGDYDDVPEGLLKYVYSAGQKSRGLLRRRIAEVALYNKVGS